MRKSVLAFFVFCAVFILFGCGKAPSKDAIKASVKKVMQVEFEIAEVKKLEEISGLYEVVLKLGDQFVVFYTDKDARFIVNGSIVEAETKKNLTMERQMALNPKMMHQQAPPAKEETKKKK